MVYYNRLVLRSNRIPAGFTSDNSVATSQALIRRNTFLRAGLTVNETASDLDSVPFMPGAGG